MSRRISFEALEFDKRISDLAFSEYEDESEEKRAKIKNVMARVIKNDLTARQREIIVLYYYNNKGVAEIAEMLHVCPSTVSRTIKAARAKIYKYLKYYFL
ncbi:RNA polymerase sigma factor [Porcipelethomonas sp.]|uniref:RNA polymerase sigma factor n=1 Tax=Porcipelethomonas sp. TaxID=2981675 RepID=UPI003EF302AD